MGVFHYYQITKGYRAMHALNADKRKLLSLKNTIANHFTSGNWNEVAVLTSCLDIVHSHRRLLRSLSFGDSDYPDCVLEVLIEIIQRDEDNYEIIESYVNEHLNGGAVNASSIVTDGPRIVFQPTVFNIPPDQLDKSLVSVMMPFSSELQPVYESIQKAGRTIGMDVKRADNIWQESTVIQDIFRLIYRSFIVVCDFSGKIQTYFMRPVLLIL